MKDKMLRADAIFDQMLAEIKEAIAADTEGFAELQRKLNAAGDTREACARTTFNAEEMYRTVRLAHLGGMYAIGKLLGREL